MEYHALVAVRGQLLLLFAELPLLERPAAAYAAGFRAVEFWWPWPSEPVPADRDVDAFVAFVADSGYSLSDSTSSPATWPARTAECCPSLIGPRPFSTTSM